jgi:hypothetical protein
MDRQRLDQARNTMQILYGRIEADATGGWSFLITQSETMNVKMVTETPYMIEAAC